MKDIDDVDKENMQDPVQVALYAWDIFKYYKEREVKYKLDVTVFNENSLPLSLFLKYHIIMTQSKNSFLFVLISF